MNLRGWCRSNTAVKADGRSKHLQLDPTINDAHIKVRFGFFGSTKWAGAAAWAVHGAEAVLCAELMTCHRGGTGAIQISTTHPTHDHQGKVQPDYRGLFGVSELCNLSSISNLNPFTILQEKVQPSDVIYVEAF